ncbi:hypothetical protein CIB84_016789 [Bambusicola thoracicus]|uniref:Avidin n=1 Tax=Bambusicola thoracicus TaxID=9083 RepID=A0A2P4S5Q8_BAMTH|nr:hypothetical protein CIB84_016789 [Bambusicola thoracicus]
MVHATSPLLLLLLSLALVAPSLSARKCSLSGKWANDLGSNMTIEDVNENGEFYGTYDTAVADYPQNIKESPLLGFRQNRARKPTFGFTVRWKFSESTTVFVGQCFTDRSGKEVLKTTWLQRFPIENTDDDWKATRASSNFYTRLRTEEE